MSSVPEISVSDLQAKLSSQSMAVLDIRAPQDYQAGHIEGAQLLENSNLAEFIQQADKNQSYAVCCYRGVSSQSAVLYLKENGFKDVYSVSGGYNAWVNQCK